MIGFSAPPNLRFSQVKVKRSTISDATITFSSDIFFRNIRTFSSELASCVQDSIYDDHWFPSDIPFGPFGGTVRDDRRTDEATR